MKPNKRNGKFVTKIMKKKKTIQIRSHGKVVVSRCSQRGHIDNTTFMFIFCKRCWLFLYYSCLSIYAVFIENETLGYFTQTAILLFYGSDLPQLAGLYSFPLRLISSYANKPK